MNAPVPRLCRWLLRQVAPAEERTWLLSDLDEEAADRARSHGLRDARRWSRRQVLASLRPLVFRRIDGAIRGSWRASMEMWRGAAKDVRLAFRRLQDAPGFAAICITTLAVGIGGNTAVFTLIDRVILDPLPVARPSELYRLGDTYDCCVNSGLPGSFSLFSHDLYLHLQADAPEFSELAAFQANTRSVTIGRPDPGDVGQALDAAYVSGNYFQMLGLSPAAGRLIAAADDRAGAAPVAVISHRAWTHHFQRRSDVIGSTRLFNGVAGTIIGVAPERFYGETLRPDPPDVWIPLSNEPLMQPAARLLDTKSSRWLYVIGRLRPGVSLPALEAKLTARVQQWLLSAVELSADDQSRVPQQHVKVVPSPKGVSSLRDEVVPSLQLLQAVAGVVLLIACANLANLLLARAAARRAEIAVRVALGATRARLVGQFLVESVMLACLGGLAGLAMAYAGASAIIGLTFEGAGYVPIGATPSGQVLLFAFGISLITALVFGTAPSLIASRSNAIDAMRGAGRTADRTSKLRQSLIALQVALSLVLITCAGLLARSLHNLQQQDFGFRAERLYVASLAPSISTTPVEQMEGLYARTRERLQAVPGVSGAAFSLYSPMSGDNWGSYITVEGHDPSARATASWNRVGPGYFDTVGTPLLRGRQIDERDRPDSPLVTVVSQTFAERFFRGQDPIGRRIGFSNSSGAGSRDLEIVGVVGDAKYQDGRAAPYVMFFLPFLQRESSRSASAAQRVDRSQYAQALLVRAAGGSAALEQDIRRALAEVDRRLIVRAFRPMSDQVAGHFNLERLIARLTVVFGSTALLLACLGIYGVTSYSVTRRTREIGIRMALGASRARVLTTVLRGALVQLALGVALGVPAALATARLLQSTLFGVDPMDPLVLGAGLVVLTLAATAAAVVPAHRAATMAPVRALRVE